MTGKRGCDVAYNVVPFAFVYSANCQICDILVCHLFLFLVSLFVVLRDIILSCARDVA